MNSMIFDDTLPAQKLRTTMANSQRDSSLNSLPDVRRRLREIAASELAIRDLQDAIQNLHRELDVAVQQHAANAAPIQVRLAEEIPAAERIEQRTQLGELNSRLDDAAKRINSRIAAGEEEIRLLQAANVAKDALKNKLFTLGDPDLLDRHEVAANSVKWATSRHLAAEKLLERLEAELPRSPRQEEPEKPAGMWRKLLRGLPVPSLAEEDAEVAHSKRRINVCKMDMAVARKQLDAAQAEVDKLHRQIVSE